MPERDVALDSNLCTSGVAMKVAGDEAWMALIGLRGTFDAARVEAALVLLGKLAGLVADSRQILVLWRQEQLAAERAQRGQPA